MVSMTTGGASLKKAISLYSPLIDYSAPLLQQTPEVNTNSINQITLQQQQQLLTQVRHRSAGVTQQTQSTPSAAQPQTPSSALTTNNSNNHLNGNHHLQMTNTSNTTLSECSNNFMNSVVHELNSIKLINNGNVSGLGQGHPTNTTLNINCRAGNTEHNMLFGLSNGGVVGVGDSNNSISILSNNNNCNKQLNNLWGQLPPANNNTNNTTTNNNTNTLLYNQATTNISNLWGCSSTSSSSGVTNNNNNNTNNQINNTTSSHPSLSPISSSSVRSSQYHSASSHRSNSKESLWASSQSSPNSNLRESFYSIKSNASPTSSTTSSNGSTCSSNGGGGGGAGNGASILSQNTNLWETPLVGASKLQAIDTASSYANQLNKISNIWEIPNPAANVANICNPKPQPQNQLQQQHQQQRNGMNTPFLGQSRDLLFNDLWSNTESCSATLNSSDHLQHQQQLLNNKSNQFVANVGSDNKLQSDTIGSIWRTTTTPSIGAHQQRSSNKLNCNTSKLQQRPVIGANASFFTNAIDPSATAASSLTPSVAAAASSATSSATSGSSSCMQLFSEEFINYLNMIN